MNSAHRTLSAVAAIVAILAAGPASGYTLTPAGGVVTSVTGAVTFATFDGTTPVDPVYATISGGTINGGTNPGAGGSWIGASAQTGSGVVNIVFTGFQSYFGLYWGTNDVSTNKVEMFNGTTSLGSVFGLGGLNDFWDITASSPSEYFNRIELTQPGCCFEVDNLAVLTAVPEPMTVALWGLGLAAIGARRRRAHD